MLEKFGQTWSEEDSKLYREIAAVAVPAREEQVATLLTLIPFEPKGSFRAVELGCGEGRLSYALLDGFPNASMLALDGEATMRAHASERLKRFGSRAEVDAFDLASQDWLTQIDSADCVLSSLCVHHLSGKAKQRLFREISRRLSMQGAFLLADLVEPQRPEARELFAATWDHVTEAQSVAKTGSKQSYDKFLTAHWNYYRYPDPVDQPSPLSDQLAWLKEAGFQTVDCFWMQAGHAIYGGYKSRAKTHARSVSFEAALRAAQDALR